MRPADVLQAFADGEIDLILPTQRSLELHRPVRSRRCPARRAARGPVPDLTPESPSALSPLVRRVVANNPGSDDRSGNEHVPRRYRRGRGDRSRSRSRRSTSTRSSARRCVERVRWILLTHTHPDHWPAAAKLAQEDRRAHRRLLAVPEGRRGHARARPRARRRRHDRRHRVPARGAAHARSRAEPSRASGSTRNARCSPATTCSTARRPSSTRSGAAT